MVNRNSELMKNTIILSIGQVVPKLIAIFVLPLLTTYLTKKDYGLYELTLSVASFCIPLLSVQIQQGVFRFLIDPENDKKSIITSSLIFVLVMFLLSAIPIIIAWSMYTQDTVLGILFFCSYLAEVLLTWSGQVTRGLGNNLVYSIAYIVYSVAFIFVLILILIISRTLTAKDVAIAMISAYLLAFSFLFYKNGIYNYLSITKQGKNTLKTLLKYSAPMVISSVALWVVNLSDRFLVSGFLGIEMTAVYSVANRIPNLFNSVYNIFNLAWTENTSKLTETEKKQGYYTTFFKDFYHAMVGMMIALISVSPLLFKILINNQYADAYSLMSWLYVGVFFCSLVSFFGSIYVGEKRTKDVGISSAVGAIINVVVNLLLMERFGVIIAAISTIISYLIICIYRAIDLKKYVSISYSLGSLLFGVAIVCGIAAINSSYSIVTTIISIVVTLVYNVFFNRQLILNISKALLRKVGKNNGI